DGVPGVGIPGASTRADAAVAVRLLDELERARPGLRVPAPARVRAFRDVRWPGRLEVLPGRPIVILDGAHNPESTRSLCDELPALAGGPVRLGCGALGVKPWGELATMLRPHVTEVVAVRLRQGPQHRPGADPRELAAAFAPVPARIGEDPFGETARLA